MKALVVEDVCMMQKMLEKLLIPYGKCDTASDGREALIKFNQAWINEEKYDVIFLDIMLPEISGDEVLKEIRDMEMQFGVTKKEKVKIVVCSAISDYKNVMKVLKKHCDAYISKPFEFETIINTLEKLKLISKKEIKSAKINSTTKS